MSFDWKGTIGKVAPWIAGTLGGPAAGLAVNALCNAVGLEPTQDNAQKAASMVASGSMTGEQFLALQKAEQSHMETMQAMGFKQITDLEEIAFKDRDSARNREIQTRDWMPKALGSFVTLGFFGLLYYLMKHDVPPANKDILNIMLGSLGGAWVSVISFYFGSTRTSSIKDEMIYKSTPTASTTSNTL